LRAYLMTGPGEIGLAEVPDPLCKSDQILVATEAVTSVLRSILLNLPRPGDVAVVLGCGPIGLIAAQLLRRCYGVSFLVALRCLSAQVRAVVS
jgi:L-gulonate 5-dehydrogenase